WVPALLKRRVDGSQDYTPVPANRQRYWSFVPQRRKARALPAPAKRHAVALFCARTAQGLGTGSATPAKLSAFFLGAKCLRRLQLARRAHHFCWEGGRPFSVAGRVS